ncbi:MAG: DUF4035 domain-containing protein [Candidatus Methanomethylicaceae archaeon]
MVVSNHATTTCQCNARQHDLLRARAHSWRLLLGGNARGRFKHQARLLACTEMHTRQQQQACVCRPAIRAGRRWYLTRNEACQRCVTVYAGREPSGDRKKLKRSVVSRFVCRLAIALGKTLRELADMPWSELAVWLAYSNIEPFGEQRADLRSAIVSAVIANCHRASGVAPYSPSDFMPVFCEDDRLVEVTSDEQILAELAKAGLPVREMLRRSNNG